MHQLKAALKVFLPATMGAFLLASCSHSTQNTDQSDNQIEQAEISQNLMYGLDIDSLTFETHTIRNGENLSLILNKFDLGNGIAEAINSKYKEILDATKLRVGYHYDAFFSNDTESQQLKYLVFQKSQIDFAVIDFTKDTLQVYPYTKEITLKRKFASGTIESSLWNAIAKSGGDPILAMKLHDVYAWQIDFFDTKKGDSFAVVYNEAYIDDTTALYIESIESAKFDHNGKSFNAIPFVQDGGTEYYDEEGNSLRKAFLKAPLDFFRITSKFTNARFHPVLKRYRAHHGVDYAAPTGTPVKSIGSGKVIAKGYQRGGGGNYIKVKHNGSYETSYMHLSKFAKNLQVGANVQQGQVIGYVGSTGLSTGPHLDFRVYKNGTPINPLTMDAPSALPIKKELKNSFFAHRDLLMNELDSCIQVIPVESKPIIISPIENAITSNRIQSKNDDDRS